MSISASTAVPNGTSRPTADEASLRMQVRGSSLLLLGRGCSLGLNLAVQIAVIRYLTKGEYGALAYALSLVEIGAMAAALGMDKAFLRFAAIYHERGDRARFTGAWLLTVAVPLALGGLLIAGTLAARHEIARRLQLDALTLSMLLTLVWLVPIHASASVVLSLATVLRGAGAVFMRKHLVGPLLKLALVLLVIAGGGAATHMVGALLLAGVLGLVVDAWLAGRIMREERLWSAARRSGVIFPMRAFFGYSVPLLSSDVVFLARGALMIVCLGWLTSAQSTASFRAVLPVVRLNELVLLNFSVMFTPLASRLLARGCYGELGDLYARTTAWITLLSFPVFAACVALSRPLTVLLFGDRYADAALLLVILASGCYVQACCGFNGRLLKVLDHVRPLVFIDLAAAAAALGAACVLIPLWQAVGAAVAAAGGLVLHCVMKAFALRVYVGGERSYTNGTRAAAIAITCGVFIVGATLLLHPGWVGGIALSALGTAVVWWTCRASLDVAEVFPELDSMRDAWTNFTLRIRRRRRPADQQPASQERTGSDTERPLRIAYVMSRFPKLTETFVLREMIEMERLGAAVEVFPLQRQRCSVIHPEARPFVERAHFTPLISPAIVISNARHVLSRPIVYMTTLAILLRANIGSLRYFAAVVAFFPKAVHLADLMQRARIDHVHAHFASHPAAAAWVIRRLTGIPYTFTAHGSDLHRDRHMLREKVADAAALVTISEYNRRLILDECPEAEPEHVHVIHCGIDARSFTRRTVSTPHARGDAPLQIACVGTLHEVKGQRYLLEACAKLKLHGRRCTCHLVGDGPDRQRLAALAGRLCLTDDVVFHGRKTTTEVSELLHAMDLLVAPSVPTKCGRREGIPVVLMEALGSGLPVIASNLSGIPELVRDGQTGLLTPPRDADAVAEAIETLADDPELRRRLAANGADLVERDFNVTRNTATLKELIETVHGDRLRSAAEDDAPAVRERLEAACLH